MYKYIFFFLFLSTSILAQIPAIPDFLISGEDNYPSTFIQRSPFLVTSDDDTLILTWNDLREGTSKIYAQKLDIEGNKIGNNFLSNSGTDFYYKDGYRLMLEEISSDYIISSYYSIHCRIYNSSDTEIFNDVIDGGEYPSCGTGYITGKRIITASDNSFYYLANNGGYLKLIRIKKDGSIKQLLYSDYSSVLHTAHAVNSNSDYMYARIESEYTDTGYSTGFYASFFNNNDSMVVPKLPIILYPGDEPYSYIYRFNLQAVALNDSVYKLFWIDYDYNTLYSLNLNRRGFIDGEIDSIVFLNDIDDENTVTYLTNKNDDGFYLYIGSRYWDYGNVYEYSHRLIEFNPDGDRTGNIIEYNSSTEGILQNLFSIGDGKFFAPYTDGKDVFLDKRDGFNLIERQKINTDESGSNELNSKIIRHDDNHAFTVWNDEEKSYGIKITKEGKPAGEKIPLNNIPGAFFNDGESLSTWVRETDSSVYAAGYTIYDKDLNIKTELVLSEATYQPYINIQGRVISESEFILLHRSDEGIKLILMSKDGSKIKEVTVLQQNISAERIFPDTPESFWIHYNNKLQKYSYNLDKIGPEKDFPVYFHLYIGNDRFLLFNRFVDGYGNSSLDGFIINSDMDTVKKNIYMGYLKNPDYYYLIENYDNDKFIVIKKNKHEFYGRIFSNDGVVLRDSFTINKNSTKNTSNLSFLVNNDKVFFTWSDIRADGKGFDVYGNIYDYSSLTSVKEIKTEQPVEYSLSQNYPNPFNPVTNIRFSIPGASHVNITIYDLLGKEVTTLINTEKPAGTYEIDFNGGNLASGIYYYKITAGNFISTKKMILMK